ncbi:Prostaglandin reductase 1 [Blattella germanica]|nr:Prostaglandin reductase 1 [Blattella germanica]
MEILCEAVWWSVDPYMRPYMSRYPEGTTMIGLQVAKIIDSRHADYPVGKHVVGYFGWRTHTVANVTVTPIPSHFPPYIIPEMGDLPLSLALGALGRIGNTAYFGFKELCQPKPGETVVVSGAGGAVGSHVGQMAHILGCKVIGFVGSDEKVKWLTEELKFDYAYNYHKTRVIDALNEAAPEGIDCYFDNVGGRMSSTVISCMRDFGRVAICGSISSYNEKETPLAPVVQPFVVGKQLKMEGFIVSRWKDRWMEGINQNLKWIQEGKLKWKETVTTGFENIPKAFIGMLKGENTGKAVVKA